MSKDGEPPDETPESTESTPASALVPVPAPRTQSGAGSAPPGGERRPDPISLAQVMIGIAQEAVRQENETQRHRATVEAETYQAALRVDDAVDKRKHERELAKIDADRSERAIRLKFGAALVFMILLFAAFLMYRDHIREGMEVIGACLASGLGFLAGRGVGERAGRREAVAEATSDEAS